MSSLDFAFSKIVQRSLNLKSILLMAFFAERTALKNIVDPLTKCKRISRDDKKNRSLDVFDCHQKRGMTLEEIRLCLSMSSLDFAECKIVQRSSDYRNIVDPLTKCKRISRDDKKSRSLDVFDCHQKRGMTMRGRSILSAYKKRMTGRRERL